jgi:formylglycine-generating enzyme required for sulfatase activity/outer membrane protein assembly factor BamB
MKKSFITSLFFLFICFPWVNSQSSHNTPEAVMGLVTGSLAPQESFGIPETNHKGAASLNSRLYNDSIKEDKPAAPDNQTSGKAIEKHRCKIIDFGNDHGKGLYNDTRSTSHPEIEVDVDGDGSTSDDGVAFWRYSPDDPLSPSPILYDNQEPSATFYGGLTAFFNKPNYGLTEGMINENHELRDDHNMMIHLRKDNEVLKKCYGLWYWKKEDFLNGGDEQTTRAHLDETSLMAVHISRYWAGVEGGRFVVKNGDQFYISEYVFKDALRSTQTLRPDTTRWAEYNPREPYHIVFESRGANWKHRSFEDVKAAGFYLFRDTLDKENVQVKWHSMEVWATVERENSASYHVDMTAIPQGEAFDPFHISRTEIPYSTWKKVYEWAVSNQYCFDIPGSRGYVFDRDGDMGSMDYDSLRHSAYEPATDMTWQDAVLWCNALSELEGYKPCYYSDPAKTKVLKQIKGRDKPEDYDNKYPIYVDYSANGYRLPTPGEWTYAATGGTGSASVNERIAWTGDKLKTAETASLDSTEWGLYDVIGNVWEFTWDIENAGDYFDPYAKKQHTIMGGDFLSTSQPETSSLPYGTKPSTGNFNIGFRILRADGGAIPPSNSLTADIPSWSFNKNTLLPPPNKTKPDSTIIKEELVYFSGSKTYGKPSEPHYENDNVGFTREDGADITITPFYASKFEISFKKWNEVYQWAVNHGYTFDRDGDMGSMDWSTRVYDHGPNEPVTDVGWNDAVIWCNALSEYEGLEPVYYRDTTGNDQVLREANKWRLRMEHRPGYNSATTKQFMTVYPDFSMNGYRLPTEAEWEYLYRNGDESRSPGIPSVASEEWLQHNSGGHTHDIGTVPANSYGIYDLAGNADEWVWDWINHNYYKSHNPKGSDQPNRLFGKGLKGSNFGWEAQRASQHRKERESAARPYLGFRVVRCDPGEHPAVDKFIPETVFRFETSNYDPLTGRTLRNNLHRTGNFDKTGVPQGPVSVKWEFDTKGAVKSSPVMVKGIIYIGSNDGYVYAINAEVGSLVWKYHTGAAVSASATVVDNIVYIGDEAGYFHAIYATDDTQKGETGGTLKWKVKQTDTKITNTASVLYGVAFTAWEGWSNKSKITGFDTEDGTEVWRHRQNKGNGGPGGMALDTFSFYQPVRDNLAAKGELETEVKQWTTLGLHAYNFMPIADKNSVLYAAEHFIERLDRETGKTIWNFTHGTNNDKTQYSSPAIGTTKINGQNKKVVVYAQLSGDIFGLDLSDGSKLWHYSGAGSFESSPSIAGNTLYIGCNDGYLYAVNIKNGTEKWKWNAGSNILSTPLPANSVIYVGCNNGKVYALEHKAKNTE